MLWSELLVQFVLQDGFPYDFLYADEEIVIQVRSEEPLFDAFLYKGHTSLSAVVVDFFQKVLDGRVFVAFGDEERIDVLDLCILHGDDSHVGLDDTLGLVVDLPDFGVGQAFVIFDAFKQQVLLVAEHLIECAFGHAERFGDVVHLHVLDPVMLELVQGILQDASSLVGG